MEYQKFDMRKAFIDGHTYKLYVTGSYVDQIISNKPYIKLIYSDKLNTDYEFGTTLINFKIKDFRIGEGTITVDLNNSRVLSDSNCELTKGYEMSNISLRLFTHYPHNYLLKFGSFCDNKYRKELMVNTGMVSEEEWKEHAVYFCSNYPAIIKSVNLETLDVVFATWVRYVPHDLHNKDCLEGNSYHFREFTIPLCHVFDSHYIQILGGNNYDKPVFNTIEMEKLNKTNRNDITREGVTDAK